MLLQLRNGVVAFHGGFHLRGVGDVPTWHDLMDVWTGPHALHKVYDAIAPTDVPFGQDCFGDQFILRGGVVYKLNTELGHFEQMSEDLGAFLGAAIEEPVTYLDLEALDAFREDGEELEPGMLLHVDPPFSSDEAEDGITVSAMPCEERLEYLFDHYRRFMEQA